jgi:hypothetical protein
MPSIQTVHNGQKEVDFLLSTGPDLRALEVKIGHHQGHVTEGMPLVQWMQG